MTKFIYSSFVISDISVIIIAGPTASAKSDFALKIAQKNNGVIINADSCQIYESVPILTAQPKNLPENNGLIDDIPHILYGHIPLRETYSVYNWCQAVKQETLKILAQGKTPIFVGGTGLYLKGIMDGLSFIPSIDPTIRKQIRQLSNEEIHTSLQSEDPQSANKFHVNDTQRIMRALEVIRSTGHNMAHWHQHKQRFLPENINIKALALLPNREALYTRIDQRFDKMLDNGALAEAQYILDNNLCEYAGRIIGLSELTAYLKGDITIDIAMKKAKQASRNYAKRQYTWFHHQGNYEIISPDVQS